MKIGLFDSGLGGLIVTHSLIQNLPTYDYIYLGDTARVPYGNRSPGVIYGFTKTGVEYLFKQGCQLVILACNTASAEALRKIQREYLPQHFPDRRVLGVLIPGAEEAVMQTHNGKVGVMATRGTVDSKAYLREIHKLNPDIEVFQQAAPLLVPIVEANGLKYAEPVLDDYLAPLLAEGIDTLVLGCTHYPMLKEQIRSKVGDKIAVVSQDEFIPAKLADYLKRHPEIDQKLSQNESRRFLVTDLASSTGEVARYLFGEEIGLEKIEL
ncbi:MAG TPA: glutamate racemase [Candidatus Saccharimonadales bacterium]|nr:glutamate racemase [Candidatus Saccharimonadales bacterium]